MYELNCRDVSLIPIHGVKGTYETNAVIETATIWRGFVVSAAHLFFSSSIAMIPIVHVNAENAKTTAIVALKRRHALPEGASPATAQTDRPTNART